MYIITCKAIGSLQLLGSPRPFLDISIIHFLKYNFGSDVKYNVRPYLTSFHFRIVDEDSLLKMILEHFCIQPDGVTRIGFFLLTEINTKQTKDKSNMEQ